VANAQGLNALFGIFRAGRIESAGGWRQGRNIPLVLADEPA